MTRLFAFISLASLASLAILATACGGGGKATAAPGLGDGGTTYTPTTSTQQFMDQIIDAECAYSARCETFPDKNTCLDFYRGQLSPGPSSIVYSVDQGRTILNPSAEAACLQAISNLSCSVSTSTTSSALSNACSPVFVGTIASGGDCIDDVECKPGLECDKGSCTASCCPGVCVTTKLPAAIGGSCTGNSTCVDNAYCSQAYNSVTQTFEGTCQARVAIGASCTDYGSCASNAQCVGTGASKTCVALAQDGAACASSGPSCANVASYCDPVKGICQPRLKENAPCAIPDAGAAATYLAGCMSFTQCKNGVCSRLPSAGQACSNPDAAVVDECYMVGSCVGGFCQAKPAKPVCTVAVAKAATADAGAKD
jgi:hypothetical protein